MSVPFTEGLGRGVGLGMGIDRLESLAFWCEVPQLGVRSCSEGDGGASCVGDGAFIEGEGALSDDVDPFP